MRTASATTMSYEEDLAILPPCHVFDFQQQGHALGVAAFAAASTCGASRWSQPASSGRDLFLEIPHRIRFPDVALVIKEIAPRILGELAPSLIYLGRKSKEHR